MSAVETVVAPVVAEPTTPIKPSEALRLGRLLRPRQVFGPVFDGADGACAVGAMQVGGLAPVFHFESWPNATCPRREPRRWYRRIADRLNWRTDICGLYRDVSVMSVVIHLNDDHYFPDDQIVAWLESLGL